MSRLGVAVGTSAQLAYRENTAWEKAFLPFSFCPVKHLRCAGAWGRRGPGLRRLPAACGAEAFTGSGCRRL